MGKVYGNQLTHYLFFFLLSCNNDLFQTLPKAFLKIDKNGGHMVMIRCPDVVFLRTKKTIKVGLEDDLMPKGAIMSFPVNFF